MKLRVPLRGSQAEAVKRALRYDGFGLFMEQRVGKTRAALAIVAKREPTDLLIVTLKKIIPVWYTAIEECLPEEHRIKIRVLNFDQMWNRRKALMKWMEESSRSMMIIDESHRIKSRGNRFSKACRVIAWKRSTKRNQPTVITPRAKYRLALTGTPIAQGREDAWAQFDFIDPSIFGSWARFEHRYIELGGFFNKQHRKHTEIVGYTNEEEFDRKFHNHSYRITLREARDKPLLIHKKFIRRRMQQVAQVAYDELEKKLITEVNKRKVSAKNVISLTMKLQRICGGYITSNEGNEMLVHRDKFRMLRDVLESLYTNCVGTDKSKVVICARFLSEISYIEDIVKRLNLSYTLIKGGSTFEGELQTDVAIVQIQSGIGIDLSNADVLVFYSWDYSYINHDQMKFRILNFTKRQLLYYYLIMEGTVDEQLYQTVTRKKRLADIICDHYRRL